MSWSKLFCGGFFGSDECLCFVKVGNYPSTEVKHSILNLVAWFCEKLVCVCVCEMIECHVVVFDIVNTPYLYVDLLLDNGN